MAAGPEPPRLHRLVRSGFSDEDFADGGLGWARARAAMRGGARAPLPYRAVAAARRLKIGPGWLTPNLSVLRKRR
ncbi:MAG TPA: hypothetical protein VF650_05710 [Allosphingosinicella sp.]